MTDITKMSHKELLDYANETQKYFDDNDVEFLKSLNKDSKGRREYTKMCCRRFAINYVMARRMGVDLFSMME